MSDLLSFTRAWAEIYGTGATVKQEFHKVYLAEWDETRNDSRDVAILYLRRGADLPWVLTFEGKQYRQGQCSGPAYSWVTYDLIENG